MQTIFFMSRVAAEKLYGDYRAAIISITDPNTEASLTGDWGTVLRLQFNDCAAPLNVKEKRITLFNNEMALNIQQFVHTLTPEIVTLVVHCEGGISRSAAIALVLAGHCGCELKGGNTNFANKMVMRILVDVLDP